MAIDPSDNWSYYKTIDISDVGNVSADYQMKFTIYSGNGDDNTATGEIYCDNKCLDFCDDIRFGTTSDPATATQLDQWIETSDANTIILWVKCPGSGANTFYMFIGRAATDIFTDGDATFIFFDTFPGAAVDWVNKWASTDQTKYTVAASVLRCAKPALGTEFICTQNAFSERARYRIKFREHQNTYYTSYIHVLDNPAGYVNGQFVSAPRHVAGSLMRISYIDTDDVNVPSNNNAWIPSVWHLFDTKLYDANIDIKIYQYSDMAQKATLVGADAKFGSDRYIRIYAWSTYANTYKYIDWVTVGKYSTTPPSWDTFGAWTSLASEKSRPANSIVDKAVICPDIIKKVLIC